MDLDYDYDDPLTNRQKRRRAKRGWTWCPGCDCRIVGDWRRCPRCGTRNGIKREKLRARG